MQPEKRINKNLVREILLVSILGVFIVFSFIVFTKENKARIIHQNESYVQDATVQTAKKISGLLSVAKERMEVIAYLYGEALEAPNPDMKRLAELQEMSSFDYMEYVNQDGIKMTAAGETSDVSGQEYYMEGIKGNSGMIVDFHSKDGETQVNFYAPVRYEGEIVGVLNGVYREERMKNILSAEFFETAAKNYLCLSDGTVIYSCGDDNAPENMLVRFPDTMRVSDEVYEEIKGVFREHTSLGYRYEGTQGTGNAYLTGLSTCDWMLIQTFPSGVTSSMISASNSVGVELEIKLIVSFAVYIACLLFWNWKQKKKLVGEKREMSQIVGGVTRLFQRFVYVDLEKNTYQYIKGMGHGVTEEGSCVDLVGYFTPKYRKEGEDGTDMNRVISKTYIREKLTEDTPYLQYEYQIEEDEPRWENMSILCVDRKDGVASSVLLAIQDVTALKENEFRNRKALKDAFEAADEANRAKSDFLSRMSHDIRTPMNAIMGMTAVAAMHIDDKERLTDCLNKITLSSRHLLALINDVLDMSKIESGKVTLSEEDFDMPKAVESLLAIIHPQVEAKNQTLKVNVANLTHEEVTGDSLRLQQVFVNIMGNAVKFTPEGGTIVFSISEKPSHIQGFGCYEFVFEDTGIGMEQEYLEKIFEPFSRAEGASRKIEGTGLGMPIARNIVRMMNGDIRVESKLGVGSKFTVQVYLKLRNVEEEDVECLKELHVLVADDEQDACESACELLNSIGMCADGVLSGGEAVERVVDAHENAEDYAVVILDWKMPDKNGIETAREIRKELGEEVPIIILSAYDWSAIEQSAREAGVNAFIAKPLFKSRLLYVLKSVVGNTKEEKISEIEEFGEHDYSGKRVLLAEDNELNIEIAVELLSCTGIEVEKAYNGQEAVEKMLNSPEHYFDLVFMDIQMPVKNGYEAVEEIRAAERADLKNVPIIAMSADAFSDDIRKCMRVGMNDHVAKPIELSKLLEVLEKWLG